MLKACGSYSGRYGRAKAEPRSNEKTRWEGKRGFSLCVVPLALSPLFSHFDLGSSLLIAVTLIFEHSNHTWLHRLVH